VDRRQRQRIGVQGRALDGRGQIAACPPALVLLDLTLPKGQGWEVLQRLKSHWPHVRCIVLAQTYAQERQARAAGATGALQAGFSAEALFGSLSLALAMDHNLPP